MGEAVSGKKIVYLFRVLEQASAVEGAILAYTTENSRTKSKDADSTATKDGSIRTPGVAEVEITATCYMKKDDKLPETLESAMDSDKIIEIWEANLARPIAGQTNKFEGKYYQGYLTEVELSSQSDEFAEYSLTFGINGIGVSAGSAGITVTQQQQEEADYVFSDTTKQLGKLTVSSVAGTSSGKTSITVSPALEETHSYMYKAADTVETVTYDQAISTGWTAWTSGTEITTTAGKIINMVEVDGQSKAKKFGHVAAVVNDTV